MMPKFQVDDYVMYADTQGTREVKIIGRLGNSELYVVGWLDRHDGWKEAHAMGRELSPVPDLTPKKVYPQVEQAAYALQQIANAGGLPKEVYHLLSALRDSGLIEAQS